MAGMTSYREQIAADLARMRGRAQARPIDDSGVRMTFSKFGNHKTAVNGILFDSKREAERYRNLALMERAGLISGLRLQPRYPIHVNGMKICDYVADFAYRDKETGEHVVEDAKGFRTPEYKLKKKLVRACLGIEIRET